MTLTPEHLHLALNHLPFLGPGFAIVALVVGFMGHSRAAIAAGLVIAAGSGWVTPLVMATGEAAYERYEKGPVSRYLDAGAERALETHEHRAEAWSKVLYASAAVSTLALVAMWWMPGRARAVAAVAGVFCLAALGAGIWIAESGGLIRRPDFREAPSRALQPSSSSTHYEDGD